MFSGRWQNERGSEMILKEDKGRITGEYITKVGDDRVLQKPIPIVGLASEKTIGFVVTWSEASSTTSWSGRYYKDEASGQEFIHTVWHLVRQQATTGGDQTEEIPLWQAFLTNTSVFKKVGALPARAFAAAARKSREVVIIGAGVSGLAAAKAAFEEGLDPIVLDKASTIGGLWRTAGGQIWDEMRTNLSQWTCMFSDVPWKAGTPDFPRGRSVEEYLNTYAEKFGLKSRIRLDSAVRELSACEEGWQIDLTDGKRLKVPNVICATGVFAKPFIPTTPGLDTFPGKVSHSAAYRNAAATAKKVAVIGAALSGVEIAAHLADHGKQVVIAFGHPPWIIPRFIPRGGAGVPLDLILYRRASAATGGIDDHLVRYERTAEFFEETYGNPGRVHPELAVPTKGIAPYVAISDTFLTHVASGLIKPIASRLASVNGSAIVTNDGRRTEVDEIIFCTGYESDLSYLSEDIRNKIEYKQEDKLIPFLADRTVYNPEVPGLYFVGLYRGPYFAVMELQARWAAMMISGSVPLPTLENATSAIDAERRLREVQPRPQFPHGNYVEFADSIAAAIKALPNGQGDPDVINALEHGPVVPAQFRLSGPHSKFQIASESMIEAFNRTKT